MQHRGPLGDTRPHAGHALLSILVARVPPSGAPGLTAGCARTSQSRRTTPSSKAARTPARSITRATRCSRQRRTSPTCLPRDLHRHALVWRRLRRTQVNISVASLRRTQTVWQTLVREDYGTTPRVMCPSLQDTLPPVVHRDIRGRLLPCARATRRPARSPSSSLLSTTSEMMRLGIQVTSTSAAVRPTSRMMRLGLQGTSTIALHQVNLFRLSANIA